MHGSADFTTWASLLVSIGDPDRSVIACDTDTPLSAAQASSLALWRLQNILPTKTNTPMTGEDPDELAARRTALTTMLNSTSYDIAHFAASTRGYLQWGIYGGSPETQIGDLGAWALDLVQAWNAYETARIAGYNAGACTWLKDRIGVNTPQVTPVASATPTSMPTSPP